MKVYDFWAVWCGPCKAMNPIIDAIEKTGKIEIVKINVDEQPELASEHGVVSIPTYILFDENNKEIDRKIGAATRKQFLEFCRIPE